MELETKTTQPLGNPLGFALAKADNTGFQLSDLDTVIKQYTTDCVCIVAKGEHRERDIGYIVDTRTVFLSPVLRKLLMPVEWNQLTGMVDIEGQIITATGYVLAFIYPTTGNDATVGVEALFSAHSFVGKLVHSAQAINMLCIDDPKLINRTLDPLIELLMTFRLRREELPEKEWKIIVVNSTVISNYSDLEIDLRLDDISPDVEAALCNAKETHYEMFSPVNSGIVGDLIQTIDYLVEQESTWTKVIQLIDAMTKHDQGIYALLEIVKSNDYRQKLWPVTAFSNLKVFKKPISASLLLNSLFSKLCSFEVRSIARRLEHGLNVSLNDPFVLTMGQAINLCDAFGEGYRSLCGEFVSNLNVYVGGFLADLDLSNLLITGSATPAAFLGKSGYVCEHERMMLNYSPWRFVVKKVIKSTERTLTLTPNVRVHLIVNGETTGRVIIGGSDSAYVRDADYVIDVDIVEGADLDIAVNSFDPNVIEHEMKKILAVVEKHYPGIAIVTTVQKQVGILYRIVAKSELKYTDPHKFFSFRPIEVYGSSLGRIFTHHVGPVRATYTAVFGKPELYLTATAAESYRLGNVHCHYWYFASGKTTPAAVIAKYIARDFELSYPAVLADSVTEELKGLWGSHIYGAINSVGKTKARFMDRIIHACTSKNDWWSTFTIHDYSGTITFEIRRTYPQLPTMQSAPPRCKYPLGENRICDKIAHANDMCVDHWSKSRSGRCIYIGEGEKACGNMATRGQRLCSNHYKHAQQEQFIPKPNPVGSVLSPEPCVIVPEGYSAASVINRFFGFVAIPPVTPHALPLPPVQSIPYDPIPFASPKLELLLGSVKTCRTDGCKNLLPLRSVDGMCNTHTIECMFWEGQYCPNPRLKRDKCSFCKEHACIIADCSGAKIRVDTERKSHCNNHGVNVSHGCIAQYEDGSICGNLILASDPSGVRSCTIHHQVDMEKLEEMIHGTKLSKMED